MIMIESKTKFLNIRQWFERSEMRRHTCQLDLAYILRYDNGVSNETTRGDQGESKRERERVEQLPWHHVEPSFTILCTNLD